MSTDTGDLITFIRHCLDEEERIALAAPGNHWTSHDEDSIAGASVYDEQWVLLRPERYDHNEALSNRPGATGPAYIETARDDLVAHIARFDPARVLAEVAAKRALLTWLTEAVDEWRDNHDDLPFNAPWGEDAIKILAQPYEGHPGWRDEWKVTE